MNNLNLIIAHNLTELRKKNKMTQSELAEKLNYSDKAISKWEHGDSFPGIEVLYSICQMYGITLDYLTLPPDASDKEKRKFSVSPENKYRKIIIALLSISVVWVLSTVLHITIKIFKNYNYWQLYIWAIPISCILGIIFNAIWGKKQFKFFIVSLLTWSLITAVYLQVYTLNLWPLFFIGIPIQIAIILWSQLKTHPHINRE